VDIVFSCLPEGSAIDEVVTGPNGLLKSTRKGQVVAELGSHPIAAKERQVARFAEKGVAFIDGEVSGNAGDGLSISRETSRRARSWSRRSRPLPM
jgi:3-hydroxyisobutyrate dehydrogenase-like beta-hydroxyacid dehydrogenase